jgi:hypothetical protein
MTTLRCYNTAAGARALVADTAHGRTMLADVPLGYDGRVYLVERDVDDAGELRAIAAEYATRSEQLGRPAILLDAATR